jgi:hypothetical protein
LETGDAFYLANIFEELDSPNGMNLDGMVEIQNSMRHISTVAQTVIIRYVSDL